MVVLGPYRQQMWKTNSFIHQVITDFAQYFESIGMFTYFYFEIGFDFADFVNTISVIACWKSGIKIHCLVISAALQTCMHLSKIIQGFLISSF